MPGTHENEERAVSGRSRYWMGRVGELNAIHRELQTKPKRFKADYRPSPGPILNAYREGDVAFDAALDALKEWAMGLDEGGER